METRERDFETRDESGKTALQYAVTMGHGSIAKRVLAAGADPFDAKARMQEIEDKVKEENARMRKERRKRRADRRRQKEEQARLEEQKRQKEKEERERQEKLHWERLYGKNHCMSLEFFVLQNSDDHLFSPEGLFPPLCRRLESMHSELKNDPWFFFATQSVVRCDELVASLYDRLLAKSFAPEVKYGKGNLPWHCREVRRLMAKFAPLSLGMCDDPRAVPLSVKKQISSTRQTNRTGSAPENRNDGAREDEETKTNLILKLL